MGESIFCWSVGIKLGMIFDYLVKIDNRKVLKPCKNPWMIESFSQDNIDEEVCG